MTQFLNQFIFYFTTALYVAILVRAILSWFPLSPANPFLAFLTSITEPVLAPLRRIVPRVGFLDLTPLVAILLLLLIQKVAGELLVG